MVKAQTEAPGMTPGSEARCLEAGDDFLRNVLARVERIREALEIGDRQFVEAALDDLLQDLWVRTEAEER